MSGEGEAAWAHEIVGRSPEGCPPSMAYVVCSCDAIYPARFTFSEGVVPPERDWEKHANDLGRNTEEA